MLNIARLAAGYDSTLRQISFISGGHLVDDEATHDELEVAALLQLRERAAHRAPSATRKIATKKKRKARVVDQSYLFGYWRT